MQAPSPDTAGLDSPNGPLACPVCRLLSPAGTERCDCGFDLHSFTALDKGSRERLLFMFKRRRGWRRLAAVVMGGCAGGLVGLVLSFLLTPVLWLLSLSVFLQGGWLAWVLLGMALAAARIRPGP